MKDAVSMSDCSLPYHIFGAEKWLEFAANSGIVLGNDSGNGNNPLSLYYKKCMYISSFGHVVSNNLTWYIH